MKDVSQRSGVSDTFVEAGSGLFRATLLFGSIAVALAMIVVPTADHQAKQRVAAERARELDPITTGSSNATDRKTYVARRSVLSDPSKGPCLLFPDGTQRGAC